MLVFAHLWSRGKRLPHGTSIAETGDFNATATLFGQDTRVRVAVWFVNGTKVAQFAGVGSVPNVWSIQGANAD
jgi:hypothetical protein